MSEKRDFYEILGVEKNADEKQIKSAYRKLAIKYHPDKQVGKTEAEKKQAEDSFKEIAEAYEVLSDTNKRKEYDQYGHAGKNGGGFGGMSQEEILEFMKRHNPFFNQMSDFEESQRGMLKITLDIKLEDSFKGIDKKIKYKRHVVCSSCNGLQYDKDGGSKNTCQHCGGNGVIQSQQGFMMYQQTCGHCGGRGYIIVKPCKSCGGSGLKEKEEILQINIEKGVTGGVVMSMEGKGNEYLQNGKVYSGSLVIQIREFRHEKYERNGFDLHTTQTVNIIDCLLGGDIITKTIDGKEHKFKLKIGTSDGGVFRLKNCGAPVFEEDGNFGDLYVHIKHQLPTELTNSEIKILESLKKEKNFKKH